MNLRGYYVDTNFWQNPDIRSLSQTQRGILADIFSLLCSEPKKTWWGFLVDFHCKPLTERALRVLLGQHDTALGLTTWRAACDAFIERGILKPIRIGDSEYLFCVPFSEMNSYESARRHIAMMTQEDMKKSPIDRRPCGGTEILLGYDMNDKTDESALDPWGRLCRVWIELTGGKPPLRPDMALTARIEIRDDFVKLAEKMGLDNAIQDIRKKFAEKESMGGSINSIAYIISRWRAPDWKKQFNRKPEVKEGREKKATHERLKREVTALIEQGEITNKAELFKYFPSESMEVLEVVAVEFGL